MASSSHVEQNDKLLSLLTTAGFSKSDITAFEQGKMQSGSIESLTERELAAKFGCTIDLPVDELTQNFLISQRKTDPSAFQVGTMDNLADLKLEPNREATAKLYMKGSSELNLSPQEATMFHDCKSADDVEATLRKVLKARYEKYKEMGLEGIDVYARGKKSYDPGAELKVKSNKLEILEKFAPVFYECLNKYPHSNPDNIEEEFSWVNFTIDDKPTICLVHKFGRKEGDVYVFSQRHFYVSRGHNSVQGVGGVFHLSDTKSAMVYASRTSTDQVAGFGGSAKRCIGSKIMTGKIAKNFEQARAKYNK
eukprot:CAMPEP_0119014426 /NCGR_PEP_ID=MMETSP1176-20130426/9719_1 /TAXON_ID=265551 /ORGANISM="Synedropsis recta cf, Strain CCMP1620" /LENGTH=307 /DNA_ID=CAMNT_0006967605 /DNA_START=37 /DNA_END=960 /DNA_ORIENTATION=-